MRGEKTKDITQEYNIIQEKIEYTRKLHVYRWNEGKIIENTPLGKTEGGEKRERKNDAR